jgi:hypothetical protein
MGTETDELKLYRPAEGEDGWASEVNQNFTDLDSAYVKTVTTETSSYTAGVYDVVLADASSGDMTVTLPSPDTDVQVSVKKIDSSGNTVTVATPGSETIDGNSSLTISAENVSRTVVSDGSNYFIV